MLGVLRANRLKLMLVLLCAAAVGLVATAVGSSQSTGAAKAASTEVPPSLSKALTKLARPEADAIGTVNRTKPVNWPCLGTGIDGDRIQLLYVYQTNANRFPSLLSTFEGYARQTQGVYTQSSLDPADAGGPIYLRYVTTNGSPGCSLDIIPVAVADISGDIQAIVDQISQTHNFSNRIYGMWIDDVLSVRCGATVRHTGISDYRQDGPSYSGVWPLCWDESAMAHELVHAFAGVKPTAPHASGDPNAADPDTHCTDLHDVMCYDNFGSTIDGVVQNGQSLFISCVNPNIQFYLDCNNDDYYDPVAAGGPAYNVATGNTFMYRAPASEASTFTKTTIASGAQTVEAGQPVQLTATVTSAGSGGCLLTGTVSFFRFTPSVQGLDGSGTYTQIGPIVNLGSNGTASTVVDNLPVGKYPITAEYSGSSCGYGSLSRNGLEQTVVVPANGVASFKPLADAEVRAESPNNNYGTLPTLDVNGFRKSYLKFDIGQPPAGFHIASAKLKLRAYDGAPVGGIVYKTGTDWTEAGITWSNAPAAIGSAVTFNGPAVNGQTLSFDVLSAVCSPSCPSLQSFYLYDTDGDIAGYQSHENFVPPVLEITYQIGVASFKPLADAEVRADAPTNNYGTLPTLTVGAYRKSYLKFNIGQVPAGYQISSAKLKLRAYDGAPIGGIVYKTGTDWTEAGITWNNAPAAIGSAVSFNGPAVNGQELSFDVLSGVCSPSCASLQSFYLYDTDWDLAGYQSRENYIPPVLEITYQSNYSAAVLADNPISYWKLDESTGTTAVDTKGVKNGAISGGVGLSQPGVSGSAMSFNGTTGYIGLSGGPAALRPTSVSVEAWVQTTEAFDSFVLGSTNGGYDLALFSGVHPYGIACISASNCPGAWGPHRVDNGAWHHAVMIYDGSIGEIRVYVDGSLDATLNGYGPAPIYYGSGGTGLAIGRQGDSVTFPYYYEGNLDEIAVYDHVLTPARIQAHYDAGH